MTCLYFQTKALQFCFIFSFYLYRSSGKTYVVTTGREDYDIFNSYVGATSGASWIVYFLLYNYLATMDTVFSGKIKKKTEQEKFETVVTSNV